MDKEWMEELQNELQSKNMIMHNYLVVQYRKEIIVI